MADNKVLVIDNDLRTIKVPAGFVIGVAGDKEVTRLYFKMPRYYGGFDLGQFDISINYFNAVGEGDVAIAEGIVVDADGITFSWLVDEFMTLYSGAVRFSVHLEKKNGSAVEKEFNTTYAVSRVLENLNSIGQITAKLPSIVEKLKEDLFGRFSGKIDTTLKYSGMAADAAVTGSKIKKLEYAVSSPYNFKGSCLYSALPSSALINDTYYCTDKKCRYTWNGSAWYQSSMNESDYADELVKLSSVADNRVCIYGEKEVTPENLQIMDVINPNFFDIRTAPYNSIYGYASPENNNIKFLSKNTARFEYGGGMQFSFEIDNSVHKQIYYRIESDNPMEFVRFTSDKSTLQGSTVCSASNFAEGTYDITNNHFLTFYVPANTTLSIYINAGAKPTKYIVKKDHLSTFPEKSLLCLGDSITVNCTEWHDAVKNNLGINEFGFTGQGGLTIADYVNEKCFASYVNTDFANYDIIYVMGGTNDMGQSVSIGDAVYNNGFDTRTFKGAIADLIVSIEDVAPNAILIFGTPLSGRGTSVGQNMTAQVKNSLGLTTQDYAEAMKEVCCEFGVPCLDVFSMTGINQFNRSLYIEDTVHPNSEGQKLIGKAVSNFIRANCYF